MSVKSAKRALDIMEILSHFPSGLTINEVSLKLGLPQSSTFNLIKTLTQEGYLYQDEMKKYRLGARLINLGTVAMESLDIHQISLPYLNGLMERMNETVFMSVLSGNELVYIAKILSNRSIRTTAEPGHVKPLYCTGLGKAFLAFMPEEERERLLDGMTLKQITPRTVTDRKELRSQLETFREQGYSIDDEENEEGLYCVAAPIFDARRDVIAAISVAGPKERMTIRGTEVIRDLLSTSHAISQKTGFIQ
ncbi:IclR family transcriptional regulator [Rossellomorea marisflavi]|uniref:IclR family transcriptional regulator n=1 Tax=Rossellomorea marisflavi TaxID=189381 RepID=UPI0006FE8737|nr:IclR family transcriptional regulator [Rossellomorea marisflavi]KQU60160.1 IclR family transcriptional regulator [Bacillus sp. Leaf406]MDR4936946.1 IclR family transcriptional regulator [Rossellomorea marisflavi]MDW4526719.1 IclR family transcriptional regulator [Rossellomorea marisflavi]UKS67350.1 IclR family transcriptional regulator [Rossellomorea marisflavi]WJV16907.1 IclR family transcriptional regulator [Rossellomorea marisflavi]